MIRRWFWNTYAKLLFPLITVRVFRHNNGDVGVGLFLDRECKWNLNGVFMPARYREKIVTLEIHRALKHTFK